MPSKIARQAVDSSFLAAFGYDPVARILEIDFRSGEQRRYLNVPPIEAEGFSSAVSKGKFYAMRIRGKFAAEVLTGHCEKCGDLGLLGAICTDCGCGVYRSERPTVGWGAVR